MPFRLLNILQHQCSLTNLIPSSHRLRHAFEITFFKSWSSYSPHSRTQLFPSPSPSMTASSSCILPRFALPSKRGPQLHAIISTKRASAAAKVIASRLIGWRAGNPEFLRLEFMQACSPGNGTSLPLQGHTLGGQNRTSPWREKSDV